MKATFPFLLIIISVNSFSQAPSAKDTTVILQNDIYSNFKTTQSYSGTIGFDTTDLDKKQKINPQDYEKTIKKADALFKKADYQNAANTYLLAIKENNDLGKINDRYKTASCFALLNNKDSAFLQLYRIAEKGGYYNYLEIQEDKHFNSLHTDKRWVPLIEIIKSNFRKIEDKLSSEVSGKNNRNIP